MAVRVCILDYGSGNVRSVFNMFGELASNVTVSNQPEDIENATHIVLPGVGAFGASMQKIRNTLPVELLRTIVLEKHKPFLGICVGMQVLADVGYEFGEHSGLGWIAGRVTKLDSGKLALPHVGWNNIEPRRSSAVLDNIEDASDFYFVHSYVLVPDDPGFVVATCSYGSDFCAVVTKDNVVGVQFHPEKSQRAGVLLLKNFLALS